MKIKFSKKKQVKIQRKKAEIMIRNGEGNQPFVHNLTIKE